jgi:peptidoglycan/xylan/chitin deacetylase (PgdA/CDA1 family)
MPLGELFDTVRAGGRLPDRALALTFDDGWHDSFERALPVLREFSLPATFFVTGPRPDGSREFVDEATLRAAATDPLVGLGGHTVTHPHVSTLTLQTAVRELTENRIWLTELTGIKPRFFAYPYGETLIGDRDNESLIEAAGYEAAFTTQEGLLTHRTPVQALPRNDISAFGGPDVLAWLRHAFGED